VKLNILDTFPKIKDYKNNNPSFSLETWKNYADSISPSLYKKCFINAKDYDFEKEVIPILNDALYNHFDRTESAHNSITEIVKGLSGRISKLFSLDLDINIIFYLGLCNGAGWATTLDNKQTILLGAEKISELKWHDSDTISDLICHEIAHLIHFALRGDISKPEQSVWQLYSEGFATRYSQKIYKEGFYSQNQNGWLDFCMNQNTEIKNEYLFRLKNHKNTSGFFGDWNSVMGQSDLGYYLGCEFIRHLEKTKSATKIACLSAEAITKELYNFLEI